MFEKNEWIKLFKYAGYGAAVGAGLCILLFIYELLAETWNCMCDCIGGCYLPEVSTGLTFLFVFVACVIIGFMIGLFSAFSDRRNRLDEEGKRSKEQAAAAAKQQRMKWASEVKRKSLEVANTCDKNYKNIQPLIHPQYKAETLISSILTEMANISELQGKVEAMAEDVKMKGGTSK